MVKEGVLYREWKVLNRKRFKQLTYEQRKMIEEMERQGVRRGDIADRIGVSRATIYNELRRGTVDGVYDAEVSQKRCEKYLAQKGRRPILQENVELQIFIRDKILNEGKYIAQIVDELRERNDPKLGYASYGTIFTAMKRGHIPGVTEEVYRNNLATVQKDRSLYIPKWFLQKYEIKEGQQFEITEQEGEIILKPLKES